MRSGLISPACCAGINGIEETEELQFEEAINHYCEAGNRPSLNLA
jgi:hypothetical protein